jgi:hypothetical protein
VNVSAQRYTLCSLHLLERPDTQPISASCRRRAAQVSQTLLDQLAESLDEGALRAPQVFNVGPFCVEAVRRGYDLLEHSGVQAT